MTSGVPEHGDKEVQSSRFVSVGTQGIQQDPRRLSWERAVEGAEDGELPR